MVQHRGVVAAAQQMPGTRQLQHLHRIVGIGAVDAQLRQQPAVNVVQQIRQTRHQSSSQGAKARNAAALPNLRIVAGSESW